jgi:hypothetical protein
LLVGGPRADAASRARAVDRRAAPALRALVRKLPDGRRAGVFTMQKICVV